ncbi:hypothetical protein NDA14_000354 [Ustilago hordei]|nr:hypothetical protein NDA14_000354 [Ustilago hordei]
MFSLAADSGGIRDIDNAHANFAVVCHRADSTADLSELCRNSYGLPNSMIPALPSYELRSFLVLCTQAHDTTPEQSVHRGQPKPTTTDLGFRRETPDRVHHAYTQEGQVTESQSSQHM